jgi:hypothetical protein
MAEPQIDFSTAEYAATVRIDGVAYGVRSPDWLSLFDYKRFQHIGTRLAEIYEKPVDQITADEEAEATSIVSRQCAMVLDAPSEVLEKLKDGQRVQIIDLFLELPARRPATAPTAPAPATDPSSLPTGENSSRDSAGSTAATRATG